ncbi:MAG: serine/threonine protein kinase, partial [Chloroflexi bacterium]
MEPEQFGRYVIKGELGRGGMATVFHAYDPRFERDVAIKVLPHAFLHDPQFRVRFDREAKTVALLEHPAIVPVYDFGEESEQPYIVMRYMSGGSLKERIEQGAVSTSEAAKIISRLAPALDVAHAKGIIHRDLKPGNILFDQYGNACLSDFGIARLAQSSSVATLTQGAILGTPAYMSPEQIHGDKEIDGRSDIYALGVILYEMLTGSQPYRADTPGKIMMMHVMEEVPHIRSKIADISPKVDEIIGKAMAKDPADRYLTAAEMSAALDGTMEQNVESIRVAQAPSDFRTVVHQTPPILTPAPSEATVISPPQPAPPPVVHDSAARPRTSLWAVGIIIVLLLIGGAGGGYLILGRGSGEKNPTATVETVSIASNPTATIQPVVVTDEPTQTTAPTKTSAPTKEATKAPSATPTIEQVIPPTSTSEPTATELPKLPVVGGADQIAFLNENDIWIANVDGTNLVQLTKDKTEKTNLNWTPDGQALTFISGKCVKTAALSTGEVDTLGCFDNSQYVESFEISPS